MRQLATVALAALIVIVSSVYLPLLYEKVFFERVGKTHLLFSPVTKRFIYKEKLIGPPPPEARYKAEDHHAETLYRDADGTYYTRVEFEKRLPFIYYKNMELWGLLPLRLEDQSFDARTIKANRQVLELNPGSLAGHGPQEELWPLLESRPAQARLVFPEDRFRMTDSQMEFINADTNRPDKELTAAFSRALADEGFTHPARSVHGNFIILKSFDEGVFIVDHDYRVFHVKRREGRPVVVRTPIDPALETRHIRISENRRRKYYGLLLSGNGVMHLLSYENYRPIPLPLDNYDPDRMDFKILMNPLYLTAVWSDDVAIRAVALDDEFRPVARYEHRMSRAAARPVERVFEAVFPFSLRLDDSSGGYLGLSARLGGWLSLIGLFCCLAGYVIWRRSGKKGTPHAGWLCLVAITGIYGLIAASLIGSET